MSDIAQFSNNMKPFHTYNNDVLWYISLDDSSYRKFWILKRGIGIKIEKIMETS